MLNISLAVLLYMLRKFRQDNQHERIKAIFHFAQIVKVQQKNE